MSDRTGSAPLVGRDGAIALVDDALARAASEGVVVLVSGEAGMGKSRLTGHLAARARAEGRRVLIGRTGPLDLGLTLGVMQDALRAAARGGEPAPDTIDGLTRRFPELLLPELGGVPDGGSHDRAVLFEACARYLRALAAPAGAVLVLEDLHWADATSHALVHYLARALQRDPVLLAATLREDEAPASLRALERELSRERIGLRIGLGPLAPAEVGMLVAELTGRPPSPRALRQLARRSGGNPFVVEEIVRESEACGCLDAVTGEWNDGEAFPLPRTVQELVEARLDRLDPDARTLIAGAAIVGERFDLDLAAATAGVPRDAALVAAAGLRDAGLVREATNGDLAFRHAITQESVLAGLLGAERRRLHAEALRAAERLGAPPDVMAAHALGAGDRGAAMAHSRVAAATSLAIGGATESRVHLERALGLWSTGDGERLRGGILLELGQALILLGDHGAAIPLLTESRQVFLAEGDCLSAALALVARGHARWDALDAEEALRDLRRAVDEMGDDVDPPWARMAAHGRLARALMMEGSVREAAEWARSGLAISSAEPGDDEQRERAHLLSTLGSSRLGRDDAASAMAALKESRRLAESVGDVIGTIRACQNLGAAGPPQPPAEAIAALTDGLALARESGVRRHEVWLLIARGDRKAENGAPGPGEDDLDEAGRLLEESGGWGGFEDIDLVTSRGFVALARGDFDEAARWFGEAVPGADAVGQLQLVWPARAGLAAACIGQGELDRAREALRPAMPRLVGSDGPVCHLIVGTIGLVRAALAGDEDPAIVGGLVEALDRSAFAPGIAAGAALAELAGGGVPAAGALGEAVRALERQGWVLDSLTIGGWGAEAMSGHPGRRHEAAELAAFVRATAVKAEAPGWERMAASLLRRLGVRARPPAGARGADGKLTAREAEVLALVADGLTNREIASRLVISEATAARHVANVFGKLGVHSRMQAVRTAAQRGLLTGA